jgi:hypothetical protein
MTVTLGDQIIENIRQKTTEELLAIWVSNDMNQWSGVTFDAISQTLSERGIPIPEQGVFVPPSLRYKGVKGWLLFFCITLTVLNPLVTIATLPSSLDSRVFDLMPGSRTALMVDVVLSVVVAGFGVYAGICLWRVAPGAVKKAKIFLWCHLANVAVDAYIATAVVSFIRSTPGLPSTANFADVVRGIMQGVAYVVFWYSYLNLSKRVMATYGK